jgi:hypothetical protein
MGTSNNLIGVVVLVLFSIVAAQMWLATRPHMAYGLVIPAAFLLLAGYNLYKSIYVYNPYPTMAEGMMFTFGLAGFVVSGLVLAICRTVMRRGRT